MSEIRSEGEHIFSIANTKNLRFDVLEYVRSERIKLRPVGAVGRRGAQTHWGIPAILALGRWKKKAGIWHKRRKTGRAGDNEGEGILRVLTSQKLFDLFISRFCRKSALIRRVEGTWMHRCINQIYLCVCVSVCACLCVGLYVFSDHLHLHTTSSCNPQHFIKVNGTITQW